MGGHRTGICQERQPLSLAGVKGKADTPPGHGERCKGPEARHLRSAGRWNPEWVNTERRDARGPCHSVTNCTAGTHLLLLQASPLQREELLWESQQFIRAHAQTYYALKGYARPPASKDELCSQDLAEDRYGTPLPVTRKAQLCSEHSHLSDRERQAWEG